MLCHISWTSLICLLINITDDGLQLYRRSTTNLLAFADQNHYSSLHAKASSQIAISRAQSQAWATKTSISLRGRNRAHSEHDIKIITWNYNHNSVLNFKANVYNTTKNKISTVPSIIIPLTVCKSSISLPLEALIIKTTDVILKHTIEPICNFTERSDFCDVKGSIRIDSSSSKVFIVSSEINALGVENSSWNIKAYARKDDRTAMSTVKGWSVRLVNNNSQAVPQCTESHNVPAVLFSAGAYSGNHFHAFTDIIVPLYSTARSFNGEVKLLISDQPSWWMKKFEILMRALSKYEVVNIDKRRGVDCFPSVVVGLKRLTKKELHVDPSISGYSMKDFREFLRSSYSLKKASAIKIKDAQKKRPRLLIIARKKSRAFTNVGDIARMAKKLGFNVVVAEADANLSGFAKIINSCDVVLGVHGAGLTNILFLPENAILIQVVPFGGVEWVSKHFFEEPSKQMNIRYLEYKIKVEESTLIQQYPTDHEVLRDPRVIQKQGWLAFKSIYLDKQNVKLDLNRFRSTLLKAIELLHESS
ncbi:hypothetical protein K2173_028241 [Erythroxylum novogranatense]|uniref:Glycosyltransferase 61 catalytic domain-containing protein n=1 Tax=Erythroxylum novogranatense TaxID=1862640 RepID=A0AAV8U4A8_9ROSI|nr:hypothetical protein K2173_028241 [Erythroxylum novogranatense]